MHATAAIQLNALGITCQRGFRTLFKDLDFELSVGQAQHITGANGAGKTSLLRIVAGLSEADAGSIRWNDRDIDNPESDYFRTLSFLGHRPALKAALTPLENLVSHASLHRPGGTRAMAEQRAMTALAQMQIGERQDRAVGYLSAGQRQRVALARVAMMEDSLWLLDEPATALDQQGIELLEKMLGSHLAGGGMLVFTSHQRLSLPDAILHSLDIGDFQ